MASRVAKDNAEGFTNYWEYTFNLNPSALAQEARCLAGASQDTAARSIFDLKLSSTDVDDHVPVPATMVLLTTGLLGLAASRRRR